MTAPLQIDFLETDTSNFAETEGRIVAFIGEDGVLEPSARKLNRLMKGALARFSDSKAFEKLEAGAGQSFDYPAGLAAEAVLAVKLPRKADADTGRKAGATIAKFRGTAPLTIVAGAHKQAAQIAYGLALRDYGFDRHKTADAPEDARKVAFMVSRPEAVAAEAAPMAALAEAVFFTRDLVNEPANVLTTTDFAARLAAMQDLGLDVEILEEAELEKIGMRTLLAVGQGSRSPSKVVIMRWNGAGDAQPFALVGKGVVFDTGGISLKPAGGMEDMTMDMGGAGVVAGVMRGLALRKAKANVIGIVGLVENMPDGDAQRPGDVVRSLKGDTIEVINTDAEGRLVLADIMWYVQDRFKPRGMVDLATLTGAIIIGLGHENAGVFSNNDDLCNAFLKAAAEEGEGAWRLPLSPAYDKLLKSAVADMANVGGRPAGSITAAQFLQRFVKDDTPWIHLDIAGVAAVKTDTALAPKGATGWGVRALDRLVRDLFDE
ncbi:leucyl aminopeptidase [Oceanomicrobium pacificus]|uniref:Probable cytosol aminopeptidase n=1 Tax=Oceanomicrobium pacificus TaxID=2692916 RepID=A0A6B0TX31_9RHOB|nr:leucyl aminopeptidase [Oceanomicrobium pacificus]MXU65714.1 leucyl aminopeptidase [Oceanomicrobium pacificus]